MKRFMQEPEAQRVSPSLLERMTRKQGTDCLAWDSWRVQGAGDATAGTRAESLHVLDLLVLLLANSTYLLQKPLIHTKVTETMVGQLLPLAAQIATRPC